MGKRRVAGFAGLFGHLFGCGDDGTVVPPGDPRAFDPVASYAQVARHAGAALNAASSSAAR